MCVCMLMCIHTWVYKCYVFVYMFICVGVHVSVCIHMYMCARFHDMVTRIGKMHTLLSSSFFVLQHRTEMFIDPFQISSNFSGSVFIQVLCKSGHTHSRLVADQKAYPSLDTFDSSALTVCLPPSHTVVPSLHPCCCRTCSVQHQHHPLPPQVLLVRQRQKRAMLDFPCAPPMQSASQRLQEMFPDRPHNVLPLVPGKPHLLVNHR